MRLEAKKYLYDYDNQSAARLLRDFTRGKTLLDYQRDAMLRAAVERQFEAIGEAMNRLVSMRWWQTTSAIANASLLSTTY